MPARYGRPGRVLLQVRSPPIGRLRPVLRGGRGAVRLRGPGVPLQRVALLAYALLRPVRALPRGRGGQSCRGRRCREHVVCAAPLAEDMGLDVRAAVVPGARWVVDRGRGGCAPRSPTRRPCYVFTAAAPHVRARWLCREPRGVAVEPSHAQHPRGARVAGSGSFMAGSRSWQR